MKIIQLIYSLSPGGAERFVASLSNELSQMGHEVIVCMLLSSENDTFTFNKRFLKENVRFHSMNFSRGFSIRKVLSLEKYLLEQNPDIVHCHLNVIPYVFRLALRQSKIRFVHTLHSVAENASGKKWQRSINKYYYEKGYIVPVAISQKCSNSFERYFSLPAPAIIDNGCEMPQKTYRFEYVKSEIDKLKDGRKIPIFIHVARFHEQKNQRLLIDAFNRMYATGDDFILLVIGDGFDYGAGAELKASACERVHFLGLQDNVADYLYNADVFCLSSMYEGLPISLLEALACGVVPVCTRVGGVPDVITDGETGYLCDALDIDTYVSALRRSLSFNISSKKLVDLFMESYSMKRCAESYIRLYCE